MEYFLNTEYIDHPRSIELISLGVVAADGREFYAISTEFDPAGANDFVRTTILPQLEPPDHPSWMPRAAIRDALTTFIGSDTPVFWSYGSAPWDWLAMVQLFPLGERVPDGWSYTAYDVACLVEEAGLHVEDPRLPPPPGNRHHALADARWARRVHAAAADLVPATCSQPYTDFVVDAEFIELEQEIDLISLAVVAADGREFYAVSSEFDPSRANEFVTSTVLPRLESSTSRVWLSRQEIKIGLLSFVGGAVPRFWSWGGLPYDWMVVAQLFDVDERMPNGWLYTGYDITLLASRAGFSIDPLDPRIRKHPGDAHHALADARWAQAVLRALS